MSRLFSICCVLAALHHAPFSAAAAESPLAQEVHELRRDVQMQSKKIEALTQQIAELSRSVQESSASKHSPGSTAPTIVETAKPLAPAPEPGIPKAEAVPPPIPHVVAKGETLTSIAKTYNIPLADLLNLNKNTNDRKLQIGQTIKVPTPKNPPTPAPAPGAPTETPAEKKETP